MPQLDRIIVLPQIFWFFIIFITLYTIILYYILPKFLLILKIRKLIIIKNFEVDNIIEKTKLIKYKKIRNKINNYLILSYKLIKLDLNIFKLNHSNIDNQIAKSVKNLLLYSSKHLVSLIPIKIKNI